MSDEMSCRSYTEYDIFAAMIRSLRLYSDEIGRLRKLRDELERMCKLGDVFISEDGFPCEYVLTEDLRRILVAARDPEPGADG